MCLVDQKIWEASKHLFECKVYSQKFWDVKIWDLNRPLVVGRNYEAPCISPLLGTTSPSVGLDPGCIARNTPIHTPGRHA